jgi:8-oxo-dGTP diphosphatase
MKNLVHVAVGVIEDAQGRILIARRPDHLHQGGLWEFPGGKVAEQEDVLTALRRELHEEVGIDVRQTRPLITIAHDYGDKQVWLDVHRVTKFQGEAHGREGQPVKWVTVNELTDFEFPAANHGIINAIRLPDRYMITGEFATSTGCLEKIEYAVQQGVRLVQLRAKNLCETDYLELAKQVLVIQAQGVSVLLNTSLEIFAQTNATGLHLSSRRLMQLQQRPVAMEKLLSASVHNESELTQANKIGVDFMVVSPVMPTRSHPDAIALGWQRFAELVVLANCPVYALGGLCVGDIPMAQRYGAQGIAGISGLWPSS